MTDGDIDEIVYHPHNLEGNETSFDPTVENKDFSAVESNVADNLSGNRNKVGKFIPRCRRIFDCSTTFRRWRIVLPKLTKRNRHHFPGRCGGRCGPMHPVPQADGGATE